MALCNGERLDLARCESGAGAVPCRGDGGCGLPTSGASKVGRTFSLRQSGGRLHEHIELCC